MWVIFLLSAITTAIATLIVIYIAHRIILRIEKEREKANNSNEKGEKNHE